MSLAVAVADGPRWSSMSSMMRNLSITIPRPINWAVSAFMARLRWLDEATASVYLDRDTLAGHVEGGAAGPRRQPFQQTPVPWTFLASGYFIGFMIFVRFITFGHWQV